MKDKEKKPTRGSYDICVRSRRSGGLRHRADSHTVKSPNLFSEMFRGRSTSNGSEIYDNNPRPFECVDCSTAFRIHGHLAKHLRSKIHVMKLEATGKLPNGTYHNIELSGGGCLNDVDTTDAQTALYGLQKIAKQMNNQNESHEETKRTVSDGNSDSGKSAKTGSPSIASISDTNSPTKLSNRSLFKQSAIDVFDDEPAAKKQLLNIEVGNNVAKVHQLKLLLLLCIFFSQNPSSPPVYGCPQLPTPTWPAHNSPDVRWKFEVP